MRGRAKPGNGIHMYYRERIFSIRVLMNLQLFVTTSSS